MTDDALTEQIMLVLSEMTEERLEMYLRVFIDGGALTPDERAGISDRCTDADIREIWDALDEGV